MGVLVCNGGVRIWGRREKPEFFSEEEEREKREPNWEINKIIICKVTVTVHIYTRLL